MDDSTQQAAYWLQPIRPFGITFDKTQYTFSPQGPVLVRRMSALEGLFADRQAWQEQVAADDPVVYSVASSPVPERPRELPQSITVIRSGDTAGELWMTKGHQHPDPQGEIYLGLEGAGGLLMFDGVTTSWLDMAPGAIGYIPPGWAHRSVNVGSGDYVFLAVYPGSAGHDYGWVLDHGMGQRAFRIADAFELRPYGETAGR